MATAEVIDDEKRASNRPDRIGSGFGWWLGGTRLDWGFVVLGAGLVGAGWFEAWLDRNRVPAPAWEHVPIQVAWLAITLYLAAATFRGWRRDANLDRAVPAGYGLSVAGCAIFGVGILINGWWVAAFGQEFGVPAIFRLPNLLQIAGAVLIVVGPLRASSSRGELLAGPPAVVSALLFLATVTFFTQFDHPYVDRYAAVGGVPLPVPTSRFDLFNYREEILGALGLLMQTSASVGVVVWTLRQTRLPVGSLTLLFGVTAFLAATQLGNYSMVAVGLVIGVLADTVLILARPRADRILGMHVFAVALGGLTGGVYLAGIGLTSGTWWPPDMIYGTVFACAILGGLISYVVFPSADAMRSAAVLWPALTPESSHEAPDVTADRVEHALKVLHSTRDLADNPLVGLRCLPAPTAVELRKAIEGAIEHLRTSSFQQDAQAGQILDLYYVKRIGGHYAVMMRVGLSRAAYFNRRSYGVNRLVDRLRELEEAAAPA